MPPAIRDQSNNTMKKLILFAGLAAIFSSCASEEPPTVYATPALSFGESSSFRLIAEGGRLSRDREALTARLVRLSHNSFAGVVTALCRCVL